MLLGHADGDAEPMTLPAPARASRPAVRDSERISTEIRRFAMFWFAASLAVLLFVALSSLLASSYRDDASRRAAAATAAQLAVARLQADVQRQADDVLSYRVTGDAVYRQRFQTGAAAMRRDLDDLHRAVATVATGAHDRAVLDRSIAALTAWEAAAALPLAHAHPQAGLSPVADPAPDGRVTVLTRRLQGLENTLTAESKGAISTARFRAHVADVVRQAATLLGLVILFAGGIRLLRRAFHLARDADARRQRESAWSSQIESVLAWSVRAKGAATRSQLIGFAHMVPKEAIGATCFIVSEGAANGHPSHGQPRFALQVDDAGEGLHVSVCFDHGRGDEHDHHALDLLLGHLAALWRTVLRQEELERAAGHDALTGLPNRRAFEAELRRRVALSRRRGLGFTLAIADLDHFKLVNDHLGHPEGDTVLRRSGEAIRGSLRASDRVFRVGGEEFALILETGDEPGVADLLERGREAVKGLGVEPVPGRRLSTSIGWAVYPDDAADRAELFALADAALYRAKSDGRDRVVRAGTFDAVAPAAGDRFPRV
jgi:diguanylate cyclase (GGDEF)-like protein